MKIIVDETKENLRVDFFIAENFPNFSRSKVQSEIKKGKVFVNSKVVKSSYLIKEFDVIEFDIVDVEQSFKPLPEDIDIEVVWEDENMAVINKPSGMLTHPTTIEMSGTLVNALLFKYKENLSDLNGALRPGIIHRLDRNTSGLIMIAKNNKTHEFLVQEMKERNFVKKYRAIVKGVVEKDEFEIDFPLDRKSVV